jgi:lipopolysaccharide transport system ATP-binding protein
MKTDHHRRSPAAYIELREVSVEFPVLQERERSFRHHLTRFATGGAIGHDGSKTYVRALDMLSLYILQGERVGLVGANGSGKSTLLRVISLIYPPTTGDLQVQGRIGSMLNISMGFDAELSGRANLLTRGIVMGLQHQEVEALLPEVIEFSELGEYIDLPVRTYSDGMRMRLLFSIATAVTPEILLMDEWLSVGDGAFRKRAQERMQHFVQDTGIMVLASHSRSLLEETTTRTLWLEQGRLRMDGPTREVCQAYFG